MVVVELKQWERAIGDDAHWVRFGDSSVGTNRRLHPSSQVQGYRDYLVNCAAALVDQQPSASIHGCVYLHEMSPDAASELSDGTSDAVRDFHKRLIEDCPIFCKGQGTNLAEWSRARLAGPPDQHFMDEFLALRRRPSRRLADEMAAVLQGKHPWVLLDHQRAVWSEIEKILADQAAAIAGTTKRKVVVVEGQPGSGKTVLAVLSLLTALGKHRLVESALVATTQEQQETLKRQIQLLRTNYPAPAARIAGEPIHKILDIYLVDWARNRRSARRLSEQGVPEQEIETYVKGWRDSIGSLPPPRFRLLVVDEAQGLVDPFKKRTNGVSGLGAKWRGARSWGPQGWHVLANAEVSIFFMDGEQGYRQIETTRPDDVRAWVAAEEARGESIQLVELSLGSSQFRLNGLASLVEWIERVLGFGEAQHQVASAEESRRVRSAFQFAEDPAAMRLKLMDQARETPGSARLLASYAWEWISRANPALVDSDLGGILPRRMGIPGLRFRWLPADNDKKADFLLGRGSYASPEQLFGSAPDYIATAAYPLTVRGQEFRHVGVLWGQHLVLRGDGWRVEPKLCPGTDYEQMARRAMNGNQDAARELQQMVAQSVRILLTRGTESVSVWIEDTETRQRVRESFDYTFPPELP